MPKIDAASFAAAALGARATELPPPLATGKAARSMVTMRVLTIGAERRNTSDKMPQPQRRSQRVMLIGTPGAPDNACRVHKLAEIVDSGRRLRVPLVEKDAEDKAAKDAKKAAAELAGTKPFPEAIKRNLVGHEDLEMGSMFELDLFDKQHPERMTPATVYEIHVTEFLHSSFGTSVGLSAFDRVGPIHELDILVQRRLMVATMHSTQLLPRMMPLLYRGVLSVEQAKKLRAGDCVAETRYMKTTQLMPLVQYNTTKLTTARWMRGLPATHYQDPGLALMVDEQWPRMLTPENGPTKPMPCVRFQLSARQRLLRDPKRAPQLTPADRLNDVFSTNDASFVCSFFRQGFWATGVCDERNMFDHGAGRYFVVGTPMLIPSYLSSVPMPESQFSHSATVNLEFTMTGTKDGREVDGAIAFPFEGAVNTGYPIDFASARALLAALGEKEKTRFNVDMSRVRSRTQTKTLGDKLPDHWMQTNNPLMINMLEAYEPIDEMVPDLWQMVVVPNLAPKCSATESLGYTALKGLIETRGFTEACKVFGEAFVCLARGDPVLEPALCKVLRPEMPRDFNFLLFALSREALAKSDLSFLNSRNHATLFDAAFEEVYPGDLADMGEIADDEIDLDAVDRIEADAHMSNARAKAARAFEHDDDDDDDDGDAHAKVARVSEDEDE
jgi:hypothetical protein